MLIAFGGREFEITPIGFVIGLIVLVLAALVILKVLGFVAALVRFLFGDETAITRYFSRNRERRGLDALSGSMVALASGEATLAARKAAKAEKLLQRPEITRIVSARAAELNGDGAKALGIYKSMLRERPHPVHRHRGADAPEARSRRDRHGAGARQEGLRA